MRGFHLYIMSEIDISLRKDANGLSPVLVSGDEKSGLVEEEQILQHGSPEAPLDQSEATCFAETQSDPVRA